MNNKITFVLGLIVGGAAGTFASWRILKAKYKKIADEEIESVKETFAKKAVEEPKQDTEACDEDKGRVVPEEYISLTKRYTNGDELTMSEDQNPYTIDPDEFGENDEYDTETLIYYSDGILAHFKGDIVENVGEVVGVDALTKFGENENDPDTVYVRNDILKYDYEILRDESKFTDVMKATRDTEE